MAILASIFLGRRLNGRLLCLMHMRLCSQEDSQSVFPLFCQLVDEFVNFVSDTIDGP